MGVGVFSFPDVFKLSGIAGGMLLLVAFALMRAFALRLLLIAKLLLPPMMSTPQAMRIRPGKFLGYGAWPGRLLAWQ
jgi:amino acid permease